MNASRHLLAAALAAPALTLPVVAHAAKTPLKPAPIVPGAAPHAMSGAAPQTAGWHYPLIDDELEDSWTWQASLKASGPFETRLALHLPDNGDALKSGYLLLRAEGDAKTLRLSFWKVQKGHAEKWGEPLATMALPGGVHGMLGITCNGDEVRALWNGRVVLSSWSGGSGGRMGMATQGKAALTGAKYQPTEPVVKRDDFMTAQGPDAPEVSGGWHRAAGVWRTSGMMPPKVEQSVNPNPFVFRAEIAMPRDAANPVKQVSTGASATTSASGALTTGRAVATTGSWFWNNYTVAAAVHPMRRDMTAPLVAALSAYRPVAAGSTATSADNDGITGGVDFVSRRAFLRDGSKLLAQSAPFAIAANQWHAFFLDPGPGTVRLIVDGVERLRWTGTSPAGGTDAVSQPAQGEAALLAEAGGRSEAGDNYVDFDDVKIAPNASLSDEFRAAAVGRWDDAQGEWQTRANPAGGLRLKLSTGPALTLTGDAEREEGRVEGEFAPFHAGAALQPVGVAFAARDAKNYFTARVRLLKGAPVLEVVEYRNGVGRVLESRSGFALRGSVWPQISAEWRDGVITASAYGQELTTTLPQIPAGRVGAWADGTARTAVLRNFRALGAAQSWGEAPLPDRITKDYLMDGWASNAKAWKADTTGTSWHTGDFFRDAALNLPLPVFTSASSLQLLLRSTAATPNTGSQLMITREGDKLRFALSEEGRDVKSVTVAAPSAITPLRFARQPLGADRVALRVALGDTVVLSETTAAQASKVGSRVGIKAQGLTLDWEQVKPQTASMLDYTFTSAPVDWDIASGTWEVAERWTCTEYWGFFRGDYDIAPTLWSRFATRGDYTLEAYIATPMDTTRGERSPIDLNLTVEGDGHDLSSGYSFLFGAKGRTVNRIYRGDQAVWEKGFQLPPLQESTHRDWFYVRLERRHTPKGLNFKYSVNNVLVADYTDPNPLSDDTDADSGATPLGGRIAFWTYDGSLSVARARIWHDGIGAAPAEVDADTLQASTDNSPIKNALGAWTARNEGTLDAGSLLTPVSDAGHRAVKIINPRSGGDWTTYVTKTGFNAADKPFLTWNYRVPAGVDVNLYALVDDKWREILFSGDPSLKNVSPNLARFNRRRPNAPNAAAPNAAAPNTPATPPVDFDRSITLGKIEGVQVDGKWHTATLDLASLLRSANLNTRVDALAFATPDRDYLRAGLGGNHQGATYWLSDFAASKTAPPSTVKVGPVASLPH